MRIGTILLLDGQRVPFDVTRRPLKGITTLEHLGILLERPLLERM